MAVTVIAGIFLLQTPIIHLSRATGFQAVQDSQRGCSNSQTEKNRSWVTAALHGISSPPLGLIWVMGSYYDLASPNKWLKWFFGTIMAGNCQILLRFHCIFQEAFTQRRSWPIFADFTHQCAQQWMPVLSVTYRMEDGTVWLTCLGSDKIYLSATIGGTEPMYLEQPILMAALVRIHIYKIVFWHF